MAYGTGLAYSYQADSCIVAEEQRYDNSLPLFLISVVCEVHNVRTPHSQRIVLFAFLLTSGQVTIDPCTGSRDMRTAILCRGLEAILKPRFNWNISCHMVGLDKTHI